MLIANKNLPAVQVYTSQKIREPPYTISILQFLSTPPHKPEYTSQKQSFVPRSLASLQVPAPPQAPPAVGFSIYRPELIKRQITLANLTTSVLA